MLGSSRYSQAISAQAGEIEQRLLALEKRLENRRDARVDKRPRHGRKPRRRHRFGAVWLGRPLSPGGKYGRRSISRARQGCGEAWNCGSEPDRRRNLAAPTIRARRRGRCGDSNWYGRAQFAEGLVKVTGEGAMDENRVEGTVRKVAGKVQEGVGRLTATPKSKPKEWRTKSVDRPKTCTGRFRIAPRN